MPITPSVTPLHFQDQDDQIEVKHDCFGHVTPLALMRAFYDAHGIFICTILFLMSRQLK